MIYLSSVFKEPGYAYYFVKHNIYRQLGKIRCRLETYDYLKPPEVVTKKFHPHSIDAYVSNVGHYQKRLLLPTQKTTEKDYN